MKIYPIFIPHAGCPHRCLFCAQDRSTNQAAIVNLDEAEAWLEKVLPGAGDGEIAFYGGSFSLLPRARQERCLLMAGRFVKAKRVTGIRVSTRPDALSADSVARLQAAAVTTVEIGVQSFDDAVLAASWRGHSAADSVAAIERCRTAGLAVAVQLMPGLPGGDGDEALRSLRQALQLAPAYLRIYPVVVVEGTALAELWRTGGYTPWSLDLAVEVCADMLHLCRLAGVPVIRLGLQGDPQLEANLLAGPYHQAFGQLVRSRLWRRALASVAPAGGQLIINPHDLGDARGHRGENMLWLEKSGVAMRLTTDKTVARDFLSLSGRNVPLMELSARGGRHD